MYGELVPEKGVEPLRGVNLSILGYLKEHALIVPDAQTPDWAKEFLATLRRVRLVTLPTEKNPLLYALTLLIRQLLALQLEFREQQRYWEIHTLAARMYDEWIVGKDETGHPLPVRLTDSMQASAIVEGLYHHAQLLARSPEPTGIEQLIARLQDEYLHALRTGLEDNVTGVAALVLNALDEDTELQHLVFDTFGEDALFMLFNPVKELVEQV